MKFLLKHKKFTGSIIFTYDDQGRCIGFQFDCELTDELWQFIMDNFPIRRETLSNKAYANFKIIEVQSDLSFAAFWEKYNYKIGNKKRAEKLWKLLSDHDKCIAFDAIRRYNNFLMHKPTQEKCYAETFLSQRRFENSF